VSNKLKLSSKYIARIFYLTIKHDGNLKRQS